MIVSSVFRRLCGVTPWFFLLKIQEQGPRTRYYSRKAAVFIRTVAAAMENTDLPSPCHLAHRNSELSISLHPQPNIMVLDTQNLTALSSYSLFHYRVASSIYYSCCSVNPDLPLPRDLEGERREAAAALAGLLKRPISKKGLSNASPSNSFVLTKSYLYYSIFFHASLIL